MRFLRPPATIDKSQSTLCSMSTGTMVSGSSSNSSSHRTQTTATSDSNNNVDDEDDGIESLNRSTVCVNGDDVHDGSSSECSYNECDITLIDDNDMFCDAKTDGEMLYCQVVEMLRFEVEVCFLMCPRNSSLRFSSAFHSDALFDLSFVNVAIILMNIETINALCTFCAEGERERERA